MRKLPILFLILVVLSCAIVPKEKSSPKRQVFDKTLPNYLAAEKTLLGVVMLNNEKLLEVVPVLRAEDFFLPEHRVIYSQMEAMVASNVPIDLITLTQELSKSGSMESAGGAGYLSKLSDGVPSAMNVSNYAETIKEKSRLRSLIYAVKRVEERAFSPDANSGAIVEETVSSMLALQESDSGQARIIEWNDASMSAITNLRQAKNDAKSDRRTLFRGEFGIRELDEMTSGLRRKELTLIVGPTSNGKSLLSEQLATTCDDAGYKGLIFSAEMSAESIVLRELSYDADVFFYYLRRPENLADEQIDKIDFAARRERNLAIVDSGITPARIWALTEARKRSRGLDFVIVDYDQLVIEAGIDPNSNEDAFFQHQSNFVHSAVRCAKRLDICFVLLAQLRKTPSSMKKDSKPTVDDIYGSSAMRNDPDVIIWTVRDFFLKGLDKKYERDAKAYVIKARNGTTGTVKLDFDPRRVRFFEAKKKVSDNTFEESGAQA